MSKKDQFNSADIRSEMWETLKDLREGRMTPQAALAAAKLVQTIVNSARADLEATRFMSGVQSDNAGNVVPLRLGSGQP